ncbi:hypothetical protein A8709_13600 [Paenibacillus pectinilyticus]|uniref:DUF4038 domain-containing protein n=1 Tax=Paenibacillus pectinilyticus TaxID=512399 RepID=A0A1C1A3L4_9BACL|nr:glycoside hydrolase family 140 protein [Paenibacillus pectinilyticus]OCT15138.1 hypothetical protein A8709_13600 [Paenibacillus pectinilyticus]
MERLVVRHTRRDLAEIGGKPFFWMGDTAWELFQRLTLEEVEYYFRRRSEQGFNVIQAVLLAEMDGLRAGNVYGEIPLHNLDSDSPNEAYFRHIDHVIALAEQYGLYMAILPCWGDKLMEPGVGPRIFDPGYQDQGVESAKAKAFRYGKYVGERYRDRPNLIWVLGGDRDYTEQNDPQSHLKDVIRAMSSGLAAGDNRTHLQTYHVCRSSSLYFPNEDWLDFNMTGSYHFAVDLLDSYMFTDRDYKLEPVKPTLDAEPRYENHPINWEPVNGVFEAYDSRQAAYWSVFAGACGHTYGCHDVWQFHSERFEGVWYPTLHWKDALELPGASQMGWLRSLMERGQMGSWVPDQAILVDPLEGGDHTCVLRGSEETLIYSPKGREFTIQLNKLPAQIHHLCWFDPRHGTYTPVKVWKQAYAEKMTFQPPTSGRGCDWILVLTYS